VTLAQLERASGKCDERRLAEAPNRPACTLFLASLLLPFLMRHTNAHCPPADWPTIASNQTETECTTTDKLPLAISWPPRRGPNLAP